jgi:hypothetical protein
MTTEDQYETINQKARKAALDCLEGIVKETRQEANSDRIKASRILLELTGDLTVAR